MEEEVVLLEEQLAAAHADIERLQTQLAELAARDSGHEAQLRELRSRVEASRGEAETARAELAAQAEDTQRLREAVTTAETQAREAVQRYRQTVLEREPHLPADLVAGDTVGELDAALERARQTVAQVRQHLDQQAQSLRVPAGAPARGSPDASDLTAAEKIRLGLSQT